MTIEQAAILLIDFLMLFILPFILFCIIDFIVVVKYRKKSIIVRLFRDEI